MHGIDQLYLRKVSLYLIDWRLLLYNSVIYIWGGFPNNTLKYTLLLHNLKKSSGIKIKDIATSKKWKLLEELWFQNSYNLVSMEKSPQIQFLK